MAHEEIEIDTDDLQRRMDGAMTALRHEFASLRTGRASASIVDPIQVDAYGQMTPINQLGTVNVPEPRMVVINVWDKAMIGKVERAGYALVPLDLHYSKGRVKISVGLAKGKKQFDKRETEKERDWDREKARLIRAKG